MLIRLLFYLIPLVLVTITVQPNPEQTDKHAPITVQSFALKAEPPANQALILEVMGYL